MAQSISVCIPSLQWNHLSWFYKLCRQREQIEDHLQNMFSPFWLERSSHSIYLQSIDCKHNLLESSHHKHYKLHLCFIYLFDICGGSKYLAFSSSTIKCGPNKGRSTRFLWIWGHWQWRTGNNTKTVPISRMAVFCFYLCTKLSEQHIFTAGIFSSHNY